MSEPSDRSRFTPAGWHTVTPRITRIAGAKVTLDTRFSVAP
jgi:hypothetical protein